MADRLRALGQPLRIRLMLPSRSRSSHRQGGERSLDEAAARELVQRDVVRARDIAPSENHGLVAEGKVPSARLSSIAVPTPVIHGTADPMFPLEHGQALADGSPWRGCFRWWGPVTASIEPTGRPSSMRSSSTQPLFN